MIRVKATTVVSKLAGAIAHTLRTGSPCTVACIGARAINQAIKGVVSARRYLEAESIETFVTATLNREVGSDAVDLRITPASTRAKLADADAAPTFKVSAKTNPFKLAGALATRVRESSAPEAMTFMGMGAEAVRSMVKATAAAAGYLKDDGGFTLAMVPESIAITMEGEERTAVRLTLFASR